VADKFTFTLTAHARSAHVLDEHTVTLDDLARGLGTVEVGPKDGEAIIPARFKVCSEGTHHRGIPCPGPHRLQSNVVALTGLGVDLDGLTLARYAEIIDGVAARGLECLAWETHGHREIDGGVKIRLLFPFEIELPLAFPAEWKPRWRALVDFLGLSDCDPSCSDPARLYYTPRQPEGANHQTGRVRGTLGPDGAPRRLDWRTVELPAGATANVRAHAEPLTVEETDDPVDLEEVRRRLAQVSGDHKERTQKLLKGEPLGKHLEGRREEWKRALMILALRAEPQWSTLALMEIARPSWLAECRDEPEAPHPWDHLVTLLADARPKANAKKAADARRARETREKIGAAVARLTHRQTPHIEDSKPPEGGDNPEPVEPEPYDPGLWQTILMRDTKDAIQRIGFNVKIILLAHPEFCGPDGRQHYRWDALKNRVVSFASGAARVIDLDIEATEIGNRIAMDGILGGWQPSSATIREQLLAAAHDATFDPLADYLEGLEWDGTPRLDTWLASYCGADVSGPGGAGLVGAIGAKTLVGMVARALESGVKQDSVLILEGAQGYLKSSLVALMGGAFSTETHLEADKKDTWQVMSSSWVVEWDELSSLKSAHDHNAIKGFLSRTVDTYRAPYGRSNQAYPRRAVIVGTTNDRDYLTDGTGNRRYWPVSCSRINLSALREVMPQLHAEAVVRYRDAIGTARVAPGVWRPEACVWWLDPEQERYLAAINNSRMGVDMLGEAIKAWVLEKPCESRGDFFSIDTVRVAMDVRGVKLTDRGLRQAMQAIAVACSVGPARGYRVQDPALLEAPQKARSMGAAIGASRAA
jgi:Virulence-associated protein E